MKSLLKIGLILLVVSLAVVSCSRTSKKLFPDNPGFAFYDRELPFLVGLCDEHLFGNAESEVIVLQNGYSKSSLRSNAKKSFFSKSSKTIISPSSAHIGLIEKNACVLEFSVYGVGGALSFNKFNGALGALGYRPTGTEKFGTFNTATRIFFENGNRNIGVSGRSGFGNGTGSLSIHIKRR